jgi:hypothetical protein
MKQIKVLTRHISFLIVFMLIELTLAAQRQIPIIKGDSTTSTLNVLQSCISPDYDSTTIFVQIPPAINITGLHLKSHFNATGKEGILLPDGIVYFKTPCSIGDSLYCKVPIRGICLRVHDMDSSFFSCLTSSCDTQFVPLTMFLSRDSGGTVCDTDYIYYHGHYPDSYHVPDFGAYVKGTPSTFANFYIEADSAQLHHYIAIESSLHSSSATFDWNWGDGTHDYTEYPSHIYADSGFYDICLTITDKCKTDSYCDSSFHALRTTNTMVYINVKNPLLNVSEKQSNEKLDFNIYPNPATNEITINSSFTVVNKPLAVSLLNTLGETLKEEKVMSGEKIDIKKLSAGFYFVRVNGNENWIGRFVKR